MKEIEIKTASREFILNNNSDKYVRAEKDAGPNATPDVILAHYDKLQGLIKDKQGRTIQNGGFWEKYSKYKEQLPLLSKVLNQREKALEEGEDRIHAANSLNVGHKRAFLGTLMTISAATIAGLFIFFSSSLAYSKCFEVASKIAGFGHAFFILLASAWLTALLAQESIDIGKRLKFIQNSHAELVEKVGSEIVSLETYEKYRKAKQLEEKNLEHSNWFDTENAFILVCSIFVLSSLPLIFMFFQV